MISVVIPVYNEAGNCTPLVEELSEVLSREGIAHEVIFVNDGSTDGTREEILELATRFPQVRLVSLDGNYGQSAAFAAGFERARGELLLTMDGDMQNDPADIPRLLHARSEAGLVCGVRIRREDSWVRRASSRIANAVRNRLSGDRVQDTGCSLKLFTRDCARSLPLYDGMHRFFPTLAKMEGFSVVEIPVNHRPRARGRSKYNIRNRIWRSFQDLLAVRWMKQRKLRHRVCEGEEE